MQSDISRYEHPYVTVDAVVFRFQQGKLEVLLNKRQWEPEEGRWGLPGGFVSIDERMDDVLRSKVAEKTGVSGFYMEQLKTYDMFDRDPRGRVISVVYLGLTNSTESVGDWFQIEDDALIKHTPCGKPLPEGFCNKDVEIVPFSDLAFDHAAIIHDAMARLSGKLWYTDLMRYLLPDEFTIHEAAKLYAVITKKNVHFNSFLRNLGDRVIKTGAFKRHGEEGGRPASVLRWNPDWKGV